MYYPPVSLVCSGCGNIFPAKRLNKNLKKNPLVCPYCNEQYNDKAVIKPLLIFRNGKG